MKSLIALALLASIAHAETITIPPMACGTVRNCFDVPNSSPARVQIYGGAGYSSLVVTMTETDGTVRPYTAYTSAYTFTDLLMTAPDGAVLTLNGAWSSKTKCSPRCVTHWSWLGGSIQR